MKLQARHENIAEQTTGDETMLYDLSNDKAYLLNETSAFVWQMCDGTKDLSEISQALAEKTNQLINEEIVKLAIDQLKELNLMSADAPKFFSKTSRRKAIKQIGLATMIALPVVFSLTAPTSVNAASRGCRAIGVCYEVGTPYCLPGCTGRHYVDTFPGSPMCGGTPYEDGAFFNCYGSPTGPSVYPFIVRS